MIYRPKDPLYVSNTLLMFLTHVAMIVFAFRGFVVQSQSKCDDTMYNSMVGVLNVFALLFGAVILVVSIFMFVTYLGTGKIPFVGSATYQP